MAHRSRGPSLEAYKSFVATVSAIATTTGGVRLLAHAFAKHPDGEIVDLKGRATQTVPEYAVSEGVQREDVLLTVG